VRIIDSEEKSSQQSKAKLKTNFLV